MRLAPHRVTALAALATLLAGCNSPPEQTTHANTTVEGTVHLCSSCHGIAGHSVSPTFPQLAAQQPDYLETQLLAFRDHSRADPHAQTYMWGMAAHLDDATIHGLAAYYSAQPPAPPETADPALRRRGGELFAKGIEDRGVPACASCHGDDALGQGAFPRLADQHAGYLAEQLHNFRDNARANETMHQTALPLADDEIAALAAYLSSL